MRSSADAEEPRDAPQIRTRRRSESAYIHQVNFFYSFYVRLGREMVPR